MQNIYTIKKNLNKWWFWFWIVREQMTGASGAKTAQQVSVTKETVKEVTIALRSTGNTSLKDESTVMAIWLLWCVCISVDR